MPFPVDAAHPQMSGLLIPEIWSPRVLEKFYEFSVLEHIANTDYEGEIRKFGDKVNIRLRPDIEIKDYAKGQELDLQRPDQPMTELEIDRGKYWNFLVEDVDRAQSDLAYMEEWTQDAAEAMNEAINEIVLGEIYADAHADNQGATAGTRTGFFNLGAVGTPVALSPENVVDKIGDAAATLTEHKVPETDRWMVLPAWVCQMIFSSPTKHALVTGNDQELLRKGHIGNLAGFEIFKSNQLAMNPDPPEGEGEGENGLATNIIFGHIKALSFASQLVNSEVIRSERFFGHFARGLNVFGFNVLKPDALGLLYATRATE